MPNEVELRMCACGKPADCPIAEAMCQDCWEKHCDTAWWKEVKAVEVEQRLREIEERVSRATPGPWEAYGVGGIHMDGTSDGYSLMTARGRRLHSPYMTQADAGFAAHAREDVPWLLSLLREREEEIRRLRTLLERARIGAWHEACGGREDPDPTWHCCDWRALAEEIDEALRGAQP